MKNLLFICVCLLLSACETASLELVITEPVIVETVTVETVTVETVAVEFVSHRGIYSDDNTLQGFYNAINLGFDSIEVDIRMHNGVVVLAHDKTIDGVAYETLESLLYFASNNNVKLWIETKEYRAVAPTMSQLSAYNLDVVFFSYRQADIDLAISIDPEITTGILITRESQLDDVIDAEWVALPHQFVIVNYDKIKHLNIAAWTIKKQSEYDDVKDYVDAIISDIEITE